MSDRTSTINILGVPIDSLTLAEAQSAVAGFIENRNGHPAKAVFFANVHSFHIAGQNSGFFKTLQKADLILPDGSGLKIAGTLFGQPIRENLNGTDFTPSLLSIAEQKGWTVYLFGGRHGTARAAAASLQATFPRLSIVGWSNGFLDSAEEAIVAGDMRRKSPDIVLVGLGSPKQEEWIASHRSDVGAAVCLGVGGLFDFLAGKFRRAPKWMRMLELEWLYRFLQDPKTKWDRVFIEIPNFLFTVVFEALASGKKSSGGST